MADTLTESFCERCGTRYEFSAPTRLNPLRKTRGMIGGLKNYLTSQDAFSDAMSDAMRTEQGQLAAAQLEAFHESFNFCIDCRQYTCVNCWNDEAGRCRTCQPVPGTDDLIERMTGTFGEASPAAIASAEGTMAEDDLQRRLGLDAWPTVDLPPEPATNGDAAVEAWPSADAIAPEVAPATAGAADADAGVLAADGFVYDSPRIELEPEPEPVAAEIEPEPDPAPVAAVEPEPMVAEVEPEPEVTHVSAWDQDAAYEVWSEPEPMVAEVEPEPEPEPVAAVEPEPEPAPEPMVAEVEPEPEPEPAPRIGPSIAPIRETILRFPERPEPEPQPVPEAPLAAEDDSPEVAARRAQLDQLGLGDPGVGPVHPEPRRVVPYRSRGAAIPAGELAARAQSSTFWEASAREVASAAVANVGVQNCGGCGLSLSANARFCRRCGSPQSRSA